VEEAGCSATLPTDRGVTPLLIACREGYLPLVQWLAAHGVDIAGVAGSGLTPLHVACMTGHLPVVEWLVAAGASIAPLAPRPGGATPLHVAAHAGQLGGARCSALSRTVVKWLVGRGADPNTPAGDGSTALHVACLANHVSGVVFWPDAQAAVAGWLVLEGGASVNTIAAGGMSPLHIASMEGNLAICQVASSNCRVTQDSCGQCVSDAGPRRERATSDPACAHARPHACGAVDAARIVMAAPAGHACAHALLTLPLTLVQAAPLSVMLTPGCCRRAAAHGGGAPAVVGPGRPRHHVSGHPFRLRAGHGCR
jgi:hypothetical protein